MLERCSKLPRKLLQQVSRWPHQALLEIRRAVTCLSLEGWQVAMYRMKALPSRMVPGAEILVTGSRVRGEQHEPFWIFSDRRKRLKGAATRAGRSNSVRGLFVSTEAASGLEGESEGFKVQARRLRMQGLSPESSEGLASEQVLREPKLLYWCLCIGVFESEIRR